MNRESGTYRKVILAVCLVVTVSTIVLPYVRCQDRDYTCESCDRAASADISKLGACLGRVNNEVIDLGGPPRTLEEKHLPYLIGPYYGWGGSHRKCDVLIRVVGDEVWGCSLKGSAPEDGSSRYIYRAKLSDGSELPATVGPCLGRRYGGRGEICFTESLFDDKGGFKALDKSLTPDQLRTRNDCQSITPRLEAKAPDQKKLAEKAINAFAANLYKRLKRNHDNLVFSPYTAFENQAMLVAGAGGDTARQISAILNETKAAVPLHETMGSLTKKLVCSNNRSGGALCVANAIWVDEKQEVSTRYEGMITANYGPRINRVNFVGDPKGAANKVEEWIERETQGLIKGGIVLPSPPDPENTPLLLTSAVYFKQDWLLKFDKANTRDGAFTLLDRNTITVPMMHNAGYYRYYEDSELQVLETRYILGLYSMVIILPRADDGLPGLEESLSPERLSSWMLPGNHERVKVWIPSFKFRSSVRLDESLIALGMRDAFSMARADFFGITVDPRVRGFLYASQQTGYLSVNEEGTEAAVAGIDCGALASEGAGIHMPPPKEFRADHPFLFVIRHNESNAILLMGRLVDPR